MIATRQFYEYVKTIVTGLPENKHWDYWNENLLQEERIKNFPVPATFFEYNQILWQPSQDGSLGTESDKLPNQYGDVVFTLHNIMSKKSSGSPDKDELDHFDYIEKVFRAVHFAGKDQDFVIGKIQRQGEGQVPAHQVLRDWPMVFTVRLMEIGTTDIGGDIVEVPGATAEIIPDPQLSPYVSEGPDITFDIKS